MSTDRSPGEWNLAVRQQAAVAHLGQVGLQSSDLEEVLREAMIVAADTLGLGEVALFEVLADGRGLRGRAGLHAGKVVSRRTMTKMIVPPGKASLPGYVVQEGTEVATGDLLGDARFRAVAPDRGFEVRAAIAAPIGWESRPWGALMVYDLDLRTWTDDEVHFVQSIANTMGLAVQRSRIEQALRDSSARLDLSLSAGGLGAWSWDLDGDCLTLNASALAMYGLTTASFTGVGQEFLAHVHPDDRAVFAGQPSRTGSDEVHNFYRVIRPDTGEVRWIESWGRRTGGAASGTQLHLVGVCSDVTDQRRAQQLQEEILASEHAARVAAETARERLGFLAEAGALLGASLDLDVTLESLAELCVPYLADVSLIDLVDDDGQLVEAAGRATDPGPLADVHELRRRRAALGGKGGVYSERDVASQSRSVIHTVISDEDYQRASADAEHLEVFRRFGCHSAAVAPLVGRAGVLGVLSLQRIGDRPAFDAEDLALIEEFAARAALAIDNSRLFHSRNRVARSLQAALLPPAMPMISGLGLAARYDVAEADVPIGGDFYDVMPVGPGSWGVVVGDVCGRGPDAAALTGLVRHTLRSAVVHEREPSRVLAQTNQAMLQQIDDSRFCTAAYLRVDLDDPATGHLRVSASSAGHPRPVLVRAYGRSEPLDCAGTLLGVVDDPLLTDTHVELEPGDAIVLYTDGVTEARDGRELFGEDRLVATLAGLAGRPAEEIAAGLEQAVSAFRRSARDDMAILVVQALRPA
ncbi:SpoIIE family protein phosphatase [Aquihabitans sp. McL0605]|uniref:SpoIIE family protein phosphatase n=1 Tax=Aquihabitans sp. McL0605 TaxID=3415671 RepID=UPI003CEE12C5